jgi:hypothetical protein
LFLKISLGTRFEARNCISEPCSKETYRDTLQQYISHSVDFACIIKVHYWES